MTFILIILIRSYSIGFDSLLFRLYRSLYSNWIRWNLKYKIQYTMDWIWIDKSNEFEPLNTLNIIYRNNFYTIIKKLVQI